MISCRSPKKIWRYAVVAPAMFAAECKSSSTSPLPPVYWESNRNSFPSAQLATTFPLGWATANIESFTAVPVSSASNAAKIAAKRIVFIRLSRILNCRNRRSFWYHVRYFQSLSWCLSAEALWNKVLRVNYGTYFDILYFLQLPKGAAFIRDDRRQKFRVYFSLRASCFDSWVWAGPIHLIPF